MNWSRFANLWLGGVAAVVLMTGCHPVGLSQPRTWEVYRNARYNFEFPYPQGWAAQKTVTNEDGQTFVNPQHPEVEIQGWASQATSRINDKTQPLAPGTSGQNSVQNFTTRQGLTGTLTVQIEEETSSITLTLVQDGVTYYWQGRSPSSQFASYYEFFNYVASQYRVEKGGE